MAVNQSHTENRRGAIIPYGESVLQHCHDVDLSFPQHPEGSNLFSGKRRGTLFLTSYRVIFVTSQSVSDPLCSFMMPFDLMSNCTVEQPVFDSNYIKGTIRAAPDGGWDGQATFKLAFRRGGAIKFSQMLMNAASAAARGAALRSVNYWFGSPGLFVVTGQGGVLCNQEMPCPVVVYGPQPVRYGAPPAGYGAPPGGYGAPPAEYGAPPAGYGAPPAGYGAPPAGYGAPPGGYGAPPEGYGAPPMGYGAPPPVYEALPAGNRAPPPVYEAQPAYRWDPQSCSCPACWTRGFSSFHLVSSGPFTIFRDVNPEDSHPAKRRHETERLLTAFRMKSTLLIFTCTRILSCSLVFKALCSLAAPVTLRLRDPAERNSVQTLNCMASAFLPTAFGSSFETAQKFL
ncbi:postacrosomal sheath WW domain-binding protein [Phyllostomus hastatus]|uniref:postacrosomal sheath WW domain-binding protein n=1 Tax=Phyllostomus hastatus TaxID=9423 RepID=UPI001E6851BE|nr:postacrosomal sheath WW domain-binding protein [Phyllostomus hastatus]